MMAGWIFHPLVNWIVNCDHIFWGGELNIAPKMSVNLPRSGHPMVTVNRTQCCAGVGYCWRKILYKCVYTQYIVHWTHHTSFGFIVKYTKLSLSCAVQYFHVTGVSAILRIHPNAFNTFAIQWYLPCNNSVHKEQFLTCIGFLLTSTNWTKYILPIQRNIFLSVR